MSRWNRNAATANKEAWERAKKLVDLAVRAHELERDWRTALPQRLGV